MYAYQHAFTLNGEYIVKQVVHVNNVNTFTIKSIVEHKSGLIHILT